MENAQLLSGIAHKIIAKEPITDTERRLLAAGGRFGGAKPKALIEIDGQQWVLKLFNNEPIDAPLIEHASMTLAGKAGIRVAVTRAVPLSGENAVEVVRVVDTWKEHFTEQGVCAADIESLAARIDEGTLGDQRRTFNPSFRAAPKRFRRRSPFSR